MTFPKERSGDVFAESGTAVMADLPSNIFTNAAGSAFLSPVKYEYGV